MTKNNQKTKTKT